MSYFQFKKFKVGHDRSVMKVGTDAVLLAAWVHLPASFTWKGLEIGSGCGVISLILAQRLSELQQKASLIGVDVDEASCMQMRENVEEFPFAVPIEVCCSPIQEFSLEEHRKVDLVVSNPPFFVNSLKSDRDARNRARHTDTLPLEVLSRQSYILSNAGAELALVLPLETLEKWESVLRQGGEKRWYIYRICKVYTAEGKECKRVLIQMSKQPRERVEEGLLILDREGNYTSDYRQLTSGFYLDRLYEQRLSR